MVTRNLPFEIGTGQRVNLPRKEKALLFCSSKKREDTAAGKIRERKEES